MFGKGKAELLENYVRLNSHRLRIEFQELMLEAATLLRAQDEQKMDKLHYVFSCQIDLQRRLMGIELPADRPDYISYYALGLAAEIGEVLQADKRWKHSTGGDMKSYNHQKVVEELTDCFLYLINLMLACNVDTNTLFDSFINVQNKVRSRNGLPEVSYE